MCHDDDSRPPAPPIQGEVLEHGPVELTSADGTAFQAYYAVPAEPNGRNIVVLPDVRGLHPFYEHLVVTFAEAGFRSVGIDYFGRTAGVSERGDAFEHQPHVAQIVPENVTADVAAAIEFIRRSNDGPIYTVGFCMGGSHSWRQTSADLDLAGVIGFYGNPEMVKDAVPGMARPVLMLVAGADMRPVSAFEELRDLMVAEGGEVEMHVYDGAPHSFFDRKMEEFAPACEDAWQRIMEFTS